jgi:DNA replication protein DnaC
VNKPCRDCGGQLDGNIVEKKVVSTGERVFFHETCWQAVAARQRAHREQAVSLAKQIGCRQCLERIEPDEAIVFDETGQDVLALHERCMPAHKAEREAQERRRLEEMERLRVARLEGFFQRSTDRSPAFPRSGLRFGAAEWGHPKVVNFFQAYRPFDIGSALVLGPTGCGKTTGCEAHAIDALKRAKADPKAKSSAVHFLYVTGHELSGARRRARIGDEAELIRWAMEADLLYLDEVGFEPVAPDGEIFGVVDTRYRAQLPTIVCSGLTLDAFDARYGGAFRRRLVERGVLVNSHPRAQKGPVRSVV